MGCMFVTPVYILTVVPEVNTRDFIGQRMSHAQHESEHLYICCYRRALSRVVREI